MPSPHKDTTRQRQLAEERFGRPEAGWRLWVYTVIFESDTRAGRAFDITLLTLTLTSVAVVMLDSVESIHKQWGAGLLVVEWFFTGIFSIEYVLRLLCVRRPTRYAPSFLGLVDLFSILPTYLALFFPGLHALIDVRVLRMMRIFRILKLGAYVAEFGELGNAILATRRKIAVFLSFVLVIVVVIGTLMYVVEGPANGFTSVPASTYWANTTLTTVGFGDITPKTDLGRLLSSMMMLMGWGTLAVPTGIVSAEFSARRVHQESSSITCSACGSEAHAPRAKFCSDCGAELLPPRHDTDSR